MRSAEIFLASVALRCHIPRMEVSKETVKQVMKALGRRGGLARAKKLTAKQRKESATKASKAAAAARTKKAKARKREVPLDSV
jgi:hypothetical protein